MTKSLLFCLITGAMLSALQANESLSLKLINQSGVSLCNMPVVVIEGNYLDKKSHKGITDKQGRFNLDYSKHNPIRILAGFGNPTFYTTDMVYNNNSPDETKGDAKKGKATLNVTLNERINPQEVFYATRSCALNAPFDADVYPYQKLPFNKWAGYDLLKASLLPPYGIGEVADFEVSCDLSCKPKVGSKPEIKDILLKIRFKSPQSGFYWFRKNTFSQFQFPYKVDTKAVYLKNYKLFSSSMDVESKSRRAFNTSGMVLRTRTLVDCKNNLMSAYYFVFKDAPSFWVSAYNDDAPYPYIIGSLKFSYYFNPIPNCTNMEYTIVKPLPKQ